MFNFDFENLENEFKQAVNLRQRNHCQDILDQLHIYQLYLQGIFNFTFNDDSYKAETSFVSLLDYNLTSQMQIKAYRALGRCQDIQGRFDVALVSYRKSLHIAEILESPSEQAISLQNMGMTCCKGFDKGLFDTKILQVGVTHCQDALRLLSDNSQHQDQNLLGRIWNTLGILHMNSDQWDNSIDCYRKSLKIYQALNNLRFVGFAYGNMGEIYLKQYLKHMDQSGSLDSSQYIDKARMSFEKALHLIQESDDAYEEAEALTNLGYLNQIQNDFQTALSYYEKAISIIEDSRERISSPDARASFFTTMIDTYANAVLVCIAMNQHKLAFQYAERARARTYLDTLQSADTSDLPIMTLQQIQERLPNESILLAYFTTGVIEANDRKLRQKFQRHRFPDEKTFVFVIAHDSFQLIDLKISPNNLKLASSIDYYEREKKSGFLSTYIYGKLIEPIESMLVGRDRVFVALHDFLNNIPFHQLLNANPQTEFNSSSPQLIFTPSASFLCSSMETTQQPNESCLLLGYNGGHSDLEELRYTEAKTHLIAERMAGIALVGIMPKKSFLFKNCSNYRILHFACHGQFDPAQPLQSKLYIGPDEVLTAQEVQENLTLNSDLVVIGACESGVSQVLRGNELMGFVRAFIQAGSRAVIATLWEVSEFSTRVLMEKFYEEIKSNHDIGTALHHAQSYLRTLSKEEVLEHLSNFCQGKLDEADEQLQQKITALPDPPLADPIYWAAFVLVANLDAIE